MKIFPLKYDSLLAQWRKVPNTGRLVFEFGNKLAQIATKHPGASCWVWLTRVKPIKYSTTHNLFRKRNVFSTNKTKAEWSQPCCPMIRSRFWLRVHTVDFQSENTKNTWSQVALYMGKLYILDGLGQFSFIYLDLQIMVHMRSLVDVTGFDQIAFFVWNLLLWHFCYLFFFARLFFSSNPHVLSQIVPRHLPNESVPEGTL